MEAGERRLSGGRPAKEPASRELRNREAQARSSALLLPSLPLPPPPRQPGAPSQRQRTGSPQRPGCQQLLQLHPRPLCAVPVPAPLHRGRAAPCQGRRHLLAPLPRPLRRPGRAGRRERGRREERGGAEAGA